MMIWKVAQGIYRGPRPEPLGELKCLGIKTILNLEDDMEAVERERVSAESLGIKVKNIPMSEIKRPTKRQLLDAIYYMCREDDHPIFVHCLHGQDRTGYAVAAYRIYVQGWSFKRAYQEAKDMGHKWWFAPYLLLWPKSLKELEEK